jgi:hypothetical protein
MKMPGAIVLGSVIIATAVVWHRVSAPKPSVPIATELPADVANKLGV